MPNLSAAQLERLAGEIKQLGRDLGFSKLGVAAIDLEADEARLERWLSQGRHGSMSYMERHGRKRSSRRHPERGQAEQRCGAEAAVCALQIGSRETHIGEARDFECGIG